ncbi:MAG TPA: flagellar export protein FliJ [Caproiciproducens sp.]|nr:flagellar export protein FliJ [Caproiciproducens sp.]
MKKFSFSLEKVLDFKQQALEVKKNELSVLQMKLQDIESEIEDLNRRFVESNRQMAEKMRTGLNTSEILVYKTYFDTLNRGIEKLKQEKARMEQIISDKKAEIVAANSEISGLEKLKEKQLAEYRKNVQKAEEQAIEEFVSQARVAV